MNKPPILCFETFDQWDTEPMNELFTVHQFPASGKAEDLPVQVRESIRAFAFKGHSALGKDIIDCFPSLGLIANYGVGYDTIDVGYANSKGIKVSNTPDVLTDDVADLAVGMLLALNRDIIGASNWVHNGNWATRGAYPLQRSLSGVNVGIAGLGRIGYAVAQRLQGFDTNIHYYSREKKDTPGWTYNDDLVSLANNVDVLMVTVSGGPNTVKIISRDVIQALGSDGILVNCSRGSTVDEDALLGALESGELRGAATDVFNNEPDIDPRFLKLNNVLLQPHQASATVETRKRMGRLQRDNIQRFFESKELLTEVIPESA